MQPQYIEEPAFTFFSPSQIALLDRRKVPSHVAIVLDGNRRWADRHGETHSEGHHKGADILLDIVRSAKELGIRAVTVYGFSTENWSRPQEEVSAILWLIEQYAIEQRPHMLANGVRVRCIGDIAGLPDTLQKALEDTCNATAQCNDVEMILALNYGGRDEICRAINTILKAMREGIIPEGPIDEELIAQHLDTKGLPDPDLWIRPGGERRFSNFLLWQASYAELYFTDKMWPDFTPNDLLAAVLDYQHRQRRLGR